MRQCRSCENTGPEAARHAIKGTFFTPRKIRNATRSHPKPDPNPDPPRTRHPVCRGCCRNRFGQGAAASGAANPMPVLDPDLRDAALRGLALAGYRGDPVTAAAANAALARLAATHPYA